MKILNDTGLRFWLSVAVAIGVSSCAASSMTRQDVMRQYNTVAKLSDGIEDAQGRHGRLLAPGAYQKAQAALDAAVEAARESDQVEAESLAAKGMKNLQALNTEIEENRVTMAEVIDMRSRARGKGAAGLFADDFQEADEQFREAGRLLEDDKRDEARETRPKLIDTYAKLELAALKKGTVAAAKQAILDAEEADADNYAPKTLREARAELDLALSVLDADRTKVEKSNTHANQAAWLARRAKQVSRLIGHFESQDFSDEEWVLWYQSQLQRVRNAVGDATLPFDQPNSRVVEALRANALTLKAFMEDARRTTQVTQQRVRRLEQELDAQRNEHEMTMRRVLEGHQEQLAAIRSGSRGKLAEAQRESEAQMAALKEQLSEKARAERREKQAQARFEQARRLFDPAEAEVFRQGDNVLIRLGGFDFLPGKHDIQAKNYSLLNKVVAAIDTFPQGKVQIIGHTDGSGSDSRNLKLSTARAKSVVDFLATMGHVDAGKLVSEGKGEKEPLANNETPEGRAKNRRIDVVIVNESSPAG